MSNYSHKDYRPRFKKQKMANEDNNGCPNYATGLAHIILCGASGWAIRETCYEDAPIALGCFTYLLGHGLLGILRNTHPSTTDYVEEVYKRSIAFVRTGPFALINSQLHFLNGARPEYGYALFASGLIPPLANLLIPDVTETIEDMVIVSNVGSMGYLAAMHEKYWTLGLAALTALNHFTLDTISEYFDVPKLDLLTIGLSFMVIFAVNAIKEISNCCTA